MLLDAHNAYPYDGRFGDRLDRALATGLPVAIEQDLAWQFDPRTMHGTPVVSHDLPLKGGEPSLEDYFFERIRPVLEQAVRENRRDLWPVITLNLDFKTNEPEHHAAVWELLGRYESWLTTARRTSDVSSVSDLEAGPLLVLTGEADEQERSFHDRVPVGARLRLFGAVHTVAGPRPAPRTNYRRWWNNGWSVVEREGQPKAGDWTSGDEARLTGLVKAAHDEGLWIRFYTLNGHDPADLSNGWTPGYNFGSLDAVRRRWQSAVAAGVDFVAVDQYEEFAGVLRVADSVTLRGTLTRADYERLLEREFDVPAGTTRIEVHLAYDDRERTVIDLGLRGPGGFRGWSGGGAQQISVGRHTASYGYLPGDVEPGRWAVILGVPNIREGVTASYQLRISFSRDGEEWPVLRRTAGWYAGDLHAHSGHSDGRTTGPAGSRLKAPPFRVFDAARRERLDFVALTDHNTVSHWVEVDRLQPSYPETLLLHGREVTTYRGHLNTFGERRFVDFRLGPSRTMRTLASELHAAGGFLSINHPAAPDDERCMGCGWNDRDDDTMRGIDAVEIVNGDAADGPLAGWTFWAGMLNRGHRLVAIGGSDEHTPDDTADRRLGRPGTVIFAEELSERALIAGLRAGRVYVRTRGVDGPSIDFDALGGETTARMGGRLALSASLTLRVATERAAGQQLSWIRNGEAVRTDIIGGDGHASLTLTPRSGDWFSIVLRDQEGPTLFSNAIHVTRN